MTLNWIMFLPALVLLFWPVEMFLPKPLRLKELAYLDFSEPSIWRRAPWRLPALWLDGIRAFFGVFLLRSAWGVEPMGGWLQHTPVIASFLVLMLSIGVQMDTRWNAGYFLAPVAYVVGLWLALVPLPVAMVAVVAGGVCLVAFRSLETFFFFGAAMVGGFGGMVLHAGLWADAAALLGLLPCCLSLLFHRPLTVPMKVEIVKERSRDVSEVQALRSDQARAVRGLKAPA